MEQEVDDVMTAIALVALVASRFGLCITTESAVSMHLPGIVYRPLQPLELQDIELSCLYRRDDDSPILPAFLRLIRSRRRTLQIKHIPFLLKQQRELIAGVIFRKAATQDVHYLTNFRHCGHFDYGRKKNLMGRS